MFTKRFTWLTNRKALAGLCMIVTGLGMLLILLAAVGGIVHLLNSHQPTDEGTPVLFRLAGGVVLVTIGFTGLVLGSGEDKEGIPPWSEERNKGMLIIKIRCPSCRALNEEESVYCRECGGDL